MKNTGLSNPFNYTGSKHRYLSDLLEVLPKDNDLTICDPFFGGGDLSTHLNKTWAVDASDTNQQLVEMHGAIMDGEITKDLVENIIWLHGLSKTDSDAYYKFRDFYNENKTPLNLYTLLCHSFSNYLRFSSFGFDMPFGYRTFNASMQKKLVNYAERLNERDIEIYNRNVFDIEFSFYSLLLIDPPYLNTTATYNEKNGWDEDREKALHSKIKESGCKFVYFGQTMSNGKPNDLLVEFAKDYNVKVLKNTTDQCSALKKKKGATIEVMIWNF